MTDTRVDSSLKAAKSMGQSSLEEELNKSVGTAIDNSSLTRNNLLKFIILSAIGVWAFFIPMEIGQSSGVPMVLIINAVKALLGEQIMNWLVLIVCAVLSVTFTLSRFKIGRAPV